MECLESTVVLWLRVQREGSKSQGSYLWIKIGLLTLTKLPLKAIYFCKLQVNSETKEDNAVSLVLWNSETTLI